MSKCRKRPFYAPSRVIQKKRTAGGQFFFLITENTVCKVSARIKSDQFLSGFSLVHQRKGLHRGGVGCPVLLLEAILPHFDRGTPGNGTIPNTGRSSASARNGSRLPQYFLWRKRGCGWRTCSFPVCGRRKTIWLPG